MSSRTEGPPHISNIIIRHRFHLVPLPFPFLGLLEGAIVTYWHFVAQQQHYYCRKLVRSYVFRRWAIDAGMVE